MQQFVRKTLSIGHPARRLSTAHSCETTAGSLRSILVANRGEIALRVARTAAQHGLSVTALYTAPDRQTQHALSSPFALNLGDDIAGYLDSDKIIDFAKKQGCDAIHPGYGFLSENAEFAKQCLKAGLAFIGPPWKAIEDMGDKSRSKEIMLQAGVSCIPGYHGTDQSSVFLRTKAQEIGYPLLIKAVKGGGGKGMRVMTNERDFVTQLASAKSEAKSTFGDDAVLIEKYIEHPRHVEVQIFADHHRNCVAIGERDCSVQRRHQKILEESPAPGLTPEARASLWAKARAATLAAEYTGAGTVEFILDNATGEFYFMEMNTRLQVEHPVSEAVSGLDLVEWQIRVARGEKLPLTQEDIEERLKNGGCAIEARIYAETPAKDFMPDTGTLSHVRRPENVEGVRVDAGFTEGDKVSAYYDPMIAKVIARGKSREEALLKMHQALGQYEIAGVGTNVEFLQKVVRHGAFMRGSVETSFVVDYRDDLTKADDIEDEVFAQVAIACLLNEKKVRSTIGDTPIGFTPRVYQNRRFILFEASEASRPPQNEITSVDVLQTAADRYDVSLNNKTFHDVCTEEISSFRTHTKADGTAKLQIRAFYPHTRLDSTVIFPPDYASDAHGMITVFQRNRKYTLTSQPPKWLTDIFGSNDNLKKQSVCAPMPCRILRVETAVGDVVEKNQPLVVIESMKMETVVRSPGPGQKTVKRIVHIAGDICKAGTALVEFVDDEQA